jgi:hypothetical protein
LEEKYGSSVGWKITLRKNLLGEKSESKRSLTKIERTERKSGVKKFDLQDSKVFEIN